jgi:hypothetical protein
MNGKPTPAINKAPPRMSAPKIEDTKPSKIIAVFWWVVFIVPVIFTYFATQSIALPAVLVIIRIAIMLVPARWIKRDTKEQEKQKPVALIEGSLEKVNIIGDVLKPYREEAISEWRWLMKKLHVYDYEKEERYLSTYRKLRGWDE